MSFKRTGFDFKRVIQFIPEPFGTQRRQLSRTRHQPGSFPSFVLFKTRVLTSALASTDDAFYGRNNTIFPFPFLSAAVGVVLATQTAKADDLSSEDLQKSPFHEDVASWVEKGKATIAKAPGSKDPIAAYEEALKMYQTALKIQKSLNENVSNLEEVIAQIQKELNYLKCSQNASLYLSEAEVRVLNKTLELYREKSSLLDSLQLLLDAQSSFEPHHHFLQAAVYEAKGKYLKALESYLVLSEDPVRAPTCLEKAYQLLQLAAKENPDVLIRLDAIRMTFQRHLEGLGKQSPQPKAPECFVCFSLTERDVAHWLEHTLVPDMDHAGIKPIFSFRDLNPGHFLDNFQSLAAQADAAVVVCTPEFKAKYEERKKAPVGVAMEVKIIERRLEDAQKAKTVFPIYLNGDRDQVLPSEYFNQNLATKFGHLSEETFVFRYFSHTLSLLGAIREIPKEVVREKTESFLNDVRKVLRGEFSSKEVQEWRQAQEQKKAVLQTSITDRIAAKTQVLNIPAPDQYFTGREKELAKLHDKCSHNRRVAIYGLGGVGKTALALKYAEKHQSHYQWIHFVPSSTPEAMILGLLKLADELHIPRLEKEIERLQLLKAQLEKLESEYLLVFDGVDSPDTFKEIQKHLPARGGCLLLTSRLQENWNRLNFETLSLGLFTEQEAVDYLCRALSTTDQEGAKHLAHKLGYLPLALTHAASYIRVQQCSIQKYLELFQKYEAQLFEDRFLDLIETEKTVLTTWHITMDMIEAQERFSVAKPFMNLIAFLTSEAIPSEALEMWFKDRSIDELEFRNSLGMLMKYSLLSTRANTYGTHPLVQLAARYKLSDKEKQERLDQGVNIFNRLSAGHDLEQFEKRDISNAIALNCETLIGYYDLYQCNRQSKDFLSVLNYLTRCHLHFGRLTQAHVYAEKSLALAKEMYPNLDHPSVATSLDNVGCTLGALGRHDEALKYQVDALELRKKLFGTNHLDVALSLNNVGSTIRELGKYEKALKYLLEALEIRKKAVGLDHLVTAASYNSVGLSFRDLGRHTEALEFLQKTLEIRKKELGEDHTDTGESYNNVGTGFRDLSQYEKATEYLLKALEIRKKAFGLDHPATGESYNNVGTSFKDLGRHVEALEYQLKAIDIRKKTLGEDHPLTGESYNNAGLSFRELGQYEKALECLLKDLEISQKTLGEDHPDTMFTYCNVGLVFRNLGRHAEDLQYQLKALEIRKKVLGEDHPFTGTSYNNVGLSYRDLGQYEKALENLLKGLDINKNTLGENHLITAINYNNTGLSFRDLGQYEKALEYLSKALEVRKNALRSDHPYIGISYNNVGLCFRDLGRYAEALEYQLKALEVRKKALGKDHPITGESYSNAGLSFRDLGRHAEALKCQLKALQVRKKTFREDHPVLGESYNNIGLSFRDLGRHAEALDYQLKALEIREKVFGKDHPVLGESYNNIGLSFRDLGQHAEALDYLLRALELRKKLLGHDHPDVATSLNNVGSTLGELGRQDEALKYLMEALELRKKLLGEEHPSVATSLNIVGYTLRVLGRLEEALCYLTEALELREKLLGPTHSDIAKSLNGVGITHLMLNNTQEARKYLQEAYEMSLELFGDSHPTTVKFKRDLDSIDDKN